MSDPPTPSRSGHIYATQKGNNQINVGTAQAIVWLGSAVGSGVAGNLAYDLIKKVVEQFAGRFKTPLPAASTDSESVLRYAACAAVAAQCAAHDLPVPKISQLRTRSLGRKTVGGQDVRELVVESRFRSPFSATILIPVKDLEEKGMQVTIRQPITWEEGYAKRKWYRSLWLGIRTLLLSRPVATLTAFVLLVAGVVFWIYL